MAGFDIEGARKAGYSDDEIASYLGPERGFDTGAARKAGYTGPEILEFLTKGDNRTWGEFGKDLAIKAGQGVVGLGQSAVGLADIVTGGAAGDVAKMAGYEPKRATDMLGDLSSEKQKRMEAEIQGAGKGKDLFDSFADTAAALFRNPSIVPGMVAESLPSMLAAGGGARLLAERIYGAALKEGIAAGLSGEAAAKAATAALEKSAGALKWAAAGGEGALTAGSTADQAREEGRTWDQYVGPSLAAGIGTGLIGRAAGAIPGFGDAETAFFTGVTKAAASGNRLARGIKGAIQEGILEEMPQSGQEQYWANIAQGKPGGEGVGAAMAQGMVTGAAMGGSMGAASRARTPEQQEAQTAKAVADIGAAPDIDTAIAAASDAVDNGVFFDRFGAQEALNAAAGQPESLGGSGSQEDAIPYDYWRADRPALPSPEAPSGRPVLVNDTDPTLTRGEQIGDLETMRNAQQQDRESAELGNTADVRAATARRNAVTLDENGRIVAAPQELRSLLLATPTINRPAIAEAAAADLVKVSAIATDATLTRAEKTKLIAEVVEAVKQEKAINTPVTPRIDTAVNVAAAHLSKKEANNIVGDSAFNGDSASGLESIFLADEYDGAPISLASKGFTSEEIAGLERAGMATNGQMSREQFAKYDKERGARLAGKSTLSSANSKQAAAPAITQETSKPAETVAPQGSPVEKAGKEQAIERLQMVHDSLGTTLKGEVAGAAADIRGAITEMRKPRSPADIKGSLERASQRLYAKHRPLAEVIDSIVEELYPDAKESATDGRMQSANSKQPVSSRYGDRNPDPRNSPPMQELGGFKVGDVVDVNGRTIGRSRIELLYQRRMGGGDVFDMARVVNGEGKDLDVLVGELKKVENSAKVLDAEGQQDELPPEMRAYEAKAEAAEKAQSKTSDRSASANSEQGAETVDASGSQPDTTKKIENAKRRLREATTDAKRGAIEAEIRALRRQAMEEMLPQGKETSDDVELVVQPLRPGAPPETVKVKANPGKSAEQMRAEADLMGGLADLADIFGKNTKLNMLEPEQEQKLLPVLTKVFDAAFRLGHIKFKQAAKFVLDTIRAKLGADIADALTLEHLQGAYIGMSGRYKAQGAEGIAAVSGVTDKAAIENSAEEAQNVNKAKEALNDEQNDQPAVGARNPSASGGTGRQRRARPQQPDAQLDFGDLGTGQPENVGEPADGKSGRPAGQGAAGTDVGPSAGTAGVGASGNGRARAGRGGNPDAGAGGRGGRPSADARGDASVASPAAPPPGDFVITDPLKIVGGGQVARFEKNKAAIELRNRLVEEGRKPTPEEQETIAGYTGWGSFGQELFQGTWDKPSPKAGWEKRDQWLRDNLGQNEWEGMQRSIINAHYTDPPTVLAMWDMVKRMGFKGGRVLEPSIGIGNFFGMMPVELSGRSQRAGIELDPMTGSMAQMLYPSANIQIKGYEASTTPDNFYDLVIGNWPFSEISPADRRYNRLSPTLHDYFFLKAIDQTKPGGLIVGITTKGTMDKKGVGARMEMARKAELVAAFRLPSGAFEEYAGTKVVTDIIILRKRPEPVGMVSKDGWIDVNDHDTKEGTKVPVNEYFHRNPSHVIGEIDFGHGTTTFRPGLIVHRPADMMEQLRRIVDLVPEGAFQASAPSKNITYVANHTSDRTNSLVKNDKGLFIVNGEYMAPANEVAKYELKDPARTAAREKELGALIDMRKLYGRLIDAEREGNADAQRTELRQAYEAFKKAHGTLSTSFGLGYLRKIDDPFYPALASLEIRGADDKYRPAGILTASTMRGAKKIDKPTVSDAFVLARNSSVNPTVEQIAEIANVTPAEAKSALISSGAAFELPNGDFVPSDIYLSGNVRAKMREARAALDAGNREMERNVAALEKVIPKDVPYYKIETQMGATWVPASTYADYVAHMLGMDSAGGIDVAFQAGAWKINFDSSLNHRPQATSGFGSPNVKFKRLVRAAIANQSITVKHKDEKGTEYVDEEQTKEVNGKISEMRLKFGEWLWSDPTRRLALEAEYNEVRNAYATPRFDGSFLSFAGMALSIGKGLFNLRQHQVNAIWRALVTRKSLNAHEVGTGKTFTMGGIAVESRRYGIAKKPMLFAHNANSKSVAHEIQMMYPGAKILYIDNLSKDNVKTRMHQIANDDWDLVVLPHSLIDRIDFKEETLMAMAKEEIADLELAAEEAAQEDNAAITEAMWDDEKELAKLRSPTAKQLVKSRMKIIETIKKLSQRASQDDSIPFEDMGVDMLLVDEAHEFKKPPIATKMRMKGLQTQTSNRSISMMFLTRYVRSMNNGANVHLFTGTPITNTMTEVFHMMRYMMLEEMESAALSDFDGWFGSFAREVNDVELNPAGEYEAVTRLQSFINVPELRRMIGQYMDVVFAEDMPEMQLRLVDGKRLTDKDLTEKQRAEILNGRTEDAPDRPYKKVVNENSDMTPDQQQVFQRVQGWARSWRNMAKKERKEAMLAGAPESPIIHEGIAAKASFDVRLVDAIKNAGKEGTDEMAPHPDSKPARVARNLLEIYHSDPNANQVVFMEQGMATSVTRREGPMGDKRDVRYPAFSTVQDMIKRLVAAGIPREQIALVDGSTSKDKRKEVADAMNSGKIRIVFGSTDSLGVGVNMQRNLRAMHHMDAPWMPGELEQRNGRGHRQGNQWNTVMEYRYLTDRLDGRRWQVLAIKQKFITDFMKSKGDARVIEGDAASDDGGDILSTFSEAAGDPRVLLREKYKKKFEQLQSRERMHTQAIVDARRTVAASKNSIDYYQNRLAELRDSGTIAKLDKVLNSTAGDGFSIEIGGKAYGDRHEAGEALAPWLEKNVRMGDEKEVGEFGGEPVYAKWPTLNSKPSLFMRFGNDVEVWANPTVASLESNLRHKRKTVETDIEKSIAEAEARAGHARHVAEEPFHMAAELKASEKRLDDLVADLEKNPVAAPYWLRAGAPSETEVYRNGNAYVVTGHRWADDGFYVLAKDDHGETAIPYLEATDAQNMPLYEEHAFEAPTVQTKDGDKPADAALARRSGQPKTGGTRTARDVRAELVQAYGETGIANLEREGVLWIGRFADAPKTLTRQLNHGDEGAYWNGRGYIFADNLARGQAPSVLLHEIGEHYGLEEMLGTAAYKRTIGQVKAMHAAGNKAITEAWNHVSRHYSEAEGSDRFMHEVIAKAGQDANVQQMGWFKRMLSAIRAFLIRKGFANVTSEKDLQALMLASLNKAMHDAGEVTPISGEAMATKDEREPWYSELSAQIKGARLDNMPAAQWKAFIANLTAKGVKKDEIQWSGVNEWLDGQTGKVAKADVMAFLDQNGVQVEDVMLGEPAQEMDEAAIRRKLEAMSEAEFRKELETVTGLDYDELDIPNEGREYAIDGLIEQYKDNDQVFVGESFGDTKFGQWQLPGGENYRELLLTLPVKLGEQGKFAEYDDWLKEQPWYQSWKSHGADEAEARRLYQQWFDRGGYPPEQSTTFRSSHFDQPNILAHIRFNERTDAEGKRVLFIEEIQSDWAQKGKKSGFGGGTHKAGDTFTVVRGGQPETVTAIEDTRANGVTTVERANGDRFSVTDKEGVPGAPFVGKTEAWVGLALKRMIRYAAENGFDRVAWTNGEQQAARYDLSKQVEAINAERMDDGTFQLSARRSGANGFDALADRVNAANLDQYVGKDLAKKIAEQPKRNQQWSGLDLKVGGEGMKAFYDKIVPNVANDVLKKLGGGRVGEVKIDMIARAKDGGMEMGDHLDRQENPDFKMQGQPGFDITPSMREKAMSGLPMFSRSLMDRLRGEAKDYQEAAARGAEYLDGWIDREAARRESALSKRVYDNEQRIERDMRTKLRGLREREADLDRRSRALASRRPSIYAELRKRGEMPSSMMDAQRRMAAGERLFVAHELDEKPFEVHSVDDLEGYTPDQMLALPMASRMSDQLKGLNKGAADGLFKGEPVLDRQPTTSVMARALELVGDAEFQSRVDAHLAGFEKGELSPEERAAEIEGVARTIVDESAPMASRSAPADIWDAMQSSKTAQGARDTMLALLDNPNKFNLWDKTIGTQLNKARKNEHFKRVFDALQRQQDDTAAFAIEAEAEAIDVLARMNGKAEVMAAVKSTLSGERSKDLAAVSKAIFSNIEGREGVQQVVYTDAQLKDQFGMNDRQIGMYRQSRDAIDRSLDRYAQSIALKVAQKFVSIADLRRGAMDETVEALTERMTARRDSLEAMKDDSPGEILRSLSITPDGQTRQEYVRVKDEEANIALEKEMAALDAALEKIGEIQAQAESLKQAGYAPAMRFGDYAVTGYTANRVHGGQDVEFFRMTDTKTGANALRLQLQKQHPNWQIEVSPVDKESFKLFRGISPDTVELFARFMDVEEDAAFKEYIALATSSRSAMKRMLERKGVAGFSDNLPRVLSAFITSNSRAAAQNLNGFDINDAFEQIPQNQGDVRSEAAKLIDYLRNPTDDGAKVRGFMFAYFMGGSVSSALVNLTQPVMMTAPYLHQFAGNKIGAIMARASKMAATGNVTGSELKAAFQRAEAEGVTDAHEYHQLMQEAEGGGNVPTRAVMKAWGLMFGAAEKFNRRITFLAAFEVAQGMTRAQRNGADAYEFAKDAVAETQGVYAKHNRPNWARGTTGALLFTFKQFSIAYLEFFARLPRKQQLLALGMLVLAAGLEGLPFGEDLEDLIDTIGQKLGYGTNTKKTLRKMATNALGEAGAQFALHGLSGISGIPMDVAGRLGMGNLLPGTKLLNPSVKDKGREVLEVAGAAGGMAKKALDAADQGKVAEAMPKAFTDAAKAFEMINSGEYRDTRGRKVMETGPMDAAMKLIGFQPQSVAAANRFIGEQMRDVDTVKRVESEIADQWADGIRNKSPEETAAARDRLKQWNQDNPDMPIKITMSQIIRRVKQANMTRDQRFMKTATPEMRRQMLREAAQ